MKKLFFLSFLCLCTFAMNVQAQTSPNGKINVKVENKTLTVSYKQGRNWLTLMTMPTEYDQPSKVTKEKVDYDMLMGKRKHCTNEFAKCTYSKAGDLAHRLYVRVFNDGVAFAGGNGQKVSFATSKNNWLQKWTEPYEEFFPKNRETKTGERYAYPALFEYENGVFALLSESRMTQDNAATSMWKADGELTFDLRPDGKEEGGYQTLIIGSLNEVVESTLITDNSVPNLIHDASSWVKPGVAAWVYWAYNHGSNDYNIIKRYTDMAIELKLPYVLIDAEWDNFLPPYKVEDAIKYAVDNGIKPIIWYSSSIGWVNGAPGPKYRLNKAEDREKEFAWLESVGIKGVKIDFFSGDTNQNIKFMVELLECAAKHHLLVNFHGATIPRGWQRTYPNLISTEGVYGAEWYNNVPTFTNKAAAHNAMLPFTRNVIGSMDYTPCAFTDSQHPHITTHAHELALTALYESGIQHLADRPESFLAQPQPVKDYLSQLPAAWDETRLLSGYPGEWVVMARRKGNAWYVSGINGKDTEQTLNFEAIKKVIKKYNTMTLFTDSGDKATPWAIDNQSKSSQKALPTSITCQPRGGFVMVVR